MLPCQPLPGPGQLSWYQLVLVKSPKPTRRESTVSKHPPPPPHYCHHLNQCCFIVNCTLRNKRQSGDNENSNIFIQENAFENVVCETTAILSQPSCVKARPGSTPVFSTIFSRGLRIFCSFIYTFRFVLMIMCNSNRFVGPSGLTKRDHAIYSSSIKMVQSG